MTDDLTSPNDDAEPRQEPADVRPDTQVEDDPALTAARVVMVLAPLALAALVYFALRALAV